MENPHEVDGTLQDWEEVKKVCDWKGILIGNGASIAVWDDFRYSSIYTKSQSEELDHRLTRKDIQLFETLETTNFEKEGWLLIASDKFCALSTLFAPMAKSTVGIKEYGMSKVI